MKRETTQQAGDFARRRRYALRILPLVLFFGLTAAIGSEEPQAEKAAGTVEIRLTEYSVEMPHTLPPGPTTFLIRNEGRKNHSFKIKGPGIDQMLEASVPPRQTGNLQVTLQPGEYEVYCPMGNHAAKGMTMTLTVSEKPGARGLSSR
jgi:uncharacterized cupredoxin-like copper-binding protein